MTRELYKKKHIVKCLILAVVVFVMAYIQNGVDCTPQIAGVSAFLLIPTVVSIGMFEGDIFGIFYGLFAGLLWDMSAGGNNFNAIFLVIVGYTAGMLIKTIMRNNIATQVIISSFFSITYSLGYWLFHYPIKGLENSIYMLFRYYLPMAIFTILVSTLIFILVRSVERYFKD